MGKTIFLVSVVGCCFVTFTALNIIYPIAGIKAFLFLLPGVISIMALHLAGYSHSQYFLKLKWPSPVGLVFLLLPALGLGLVVYYHHHLQFTWSVLLFVIPISAFSQELFFRSALLTVLLRITNHRRILTALLQALCFCAWHLREFLVAPSFYSIVISACLLLLLGFFWGLHVVQDRTILYTFLLHMVFLLPLKLGP